MNFLEIIERIKKCKELHDDHEVASVLSFTKSAFSERKRRNSVPYTKLELFCERENINIDWLLTGEGPMRKEPEMVAKSSVLYNDVKGDPEMEEILEILREDLPEAKTAILKILKARKALKEGVSNLFSINNVKEEG